MKNQILLSIFITFLILQSCQEKKSQKPLPTNIQPKNISAECFTAIYKQDTLDLGLVKTKTDTVTGSLVMNLDGMPEKTGTITGKFHGDTLYVNYTFTQGANKRVVFKNPLALLKKGNQLILGNGEIQTTMGASYFVKGKPIDFERVKYKFTAVECENIKE